MVKAPSTSTTARPPRRRLWQHFCRALVAGLLVAGGAYVSLPWWLPTNAIREHLVDDLARKTGCDVTIGAVRVSWDEGIDIRDLVIQNPAGFDPDGFDPDPLLVVNRLRADFSPLRLLAGKPIEYVDIEDPHLRVQFDQAGHSNVAAMEHLTEGDTVIRRVSIHQAVVDVHLPHASHRLRMEIGDMQFLSGRLNQLAQVTMSAALRQETIPAPVSFRLRTEPNGPVAAHASLNISNIQLDQLPLKRLGLPLARLTGVCSGRLDIQLNDRAIIEQFDLDLLVRRLDVDGDPPSDEFDLPPLEEARLSVSATLDPLGSTAEFKRVEVRLPGLELSGAALLRTDLHGGEDGRLPFLIQQVEGRGTLDPSALASLLSDGSAVAGEVDMQGPVSVEFRAARRGQSMRIDLSVDATEMVLRVGGETLKPAARRLRYELAGELDGREWPFAADRSALLVGDNRFEGSGSVRGIGRLVETYGRRRGAPLDATFEQLLADLRQVTWTGSCRINDLRALSDLFPPLEAVFDQVQLTGAVLGSFEVNHADGTELLLRLIVPADTELAVGALSLTKPPGREAAVVLHGTLSPHPLTLDDVLCEARIGQAYLRVQKARVRLRGGAGILPARAAGVSPARGGEAGLAFHDVQDNGTHNAGETPAPRGSPRGTPRLDLDIAGEFVAMRIEDLLLALPEADRPGLRGSLHGTFGLQTDGVQWRTHLRADATRAALDAQPYFVKPGDRPATADVDVFYTADPDRQRNAELAMNVQLPLGDVQIKAYNQSDGGFAVTGKATLRDASLLAATVPLVEPTLGGATLAGETTVSVAVTTPVTVHYYSVSEEQFSEQYEGISLALDVQADALAITPASATNTPAARPFTLASRRKAAGTPLSLVAEGYLTSNDQRLKLQLSKFNVRVDESRAGAYMSLPLSRRLDEWAGEGILAMGGIEFVPTESLCLLLPELAPIVHTYGLSGTVQLGGSFGYDATHWRAAYEVQASIHADDLGFRDVAGLTKSAGVPLSAKVSISAPHDLTEMSVVVNETNTAETDIFAYVGLTNTNDVANAYGVHWPILPRLSYARARVASKDIAALANLTPTLAPYKLRGGAKMELELGEGDKPVVRWFQLHADELAGTLGGKDWRLHGDFRVEDLDLHNPAGPRAERVVSDELELTLGDNHLWLLADVQNLPVNPRGDVQILAEFLHDQDIADWLASLQKESSGGEDEGDDALKPPPETLAADWLLYLRQTLTEADLRVSLSANTLRTLDQAVNQTYNVRMFHLDADIRQGHLQANYRGGLNGGLVSSRFEANLNDPAASLVQEIDLRELQSDEAIQPQMALFFPGNTVNGTFTRQGRLSAPMRDVLAAAIDERFPVRWAGHVKTIATDGFVEGQSAPKFVTRIFPGLNLTRYKYATMTGFAEFQPDGNVRNDMLFSGFYDVYMTGDTGPDNWGEYEIGLCLAPVSAQWNHDWQQGRIPILKFRGRIEGGKIHDQEVSYLWPDELLFKLFLERNVVYRAWVIRR